MDGIVQFVASQREAVEADRDRERYRDRKLMDGIVQFVASQREAVEADRDRERYRDRERRGDRERDRSRDRRSRRERSGRRDRRDDDGRRDSRSRNRDDRYKDQGYDEGYDDSYSYNDNEEYANEGYHDYDPTAQSYEGGSYGNNRQPRESRAADKWISDDATNTVLVKGLPYQVDEKDIGAELMMTNTPVRDVRLVKDKQTGASRGFAFVEFQSVTDAQRWMEQKQGELHLLNQYTCPMYYSTPKAQNSGGGSGAPMPNNMTSAHNPHTGGVIGDWICSKCGVHNFKRREHCFKCNISREESDRGKESDGYDQVGHNPCNTLILRGLDALTSEESLSESLSKVTMLPLKNLQVIRDQNGVSQSYAFLEMDSIANSTQLLDTVHRLLVPFEVGGKAVMVNYAKNTFSTVMASINAAQWSQAVYGGYENSTSEYAAYEQYYGTEAYQQYYDQYYQQRGADPSGSSTQTDSTNAAAAVAQAAIQQAQAAKAYTKGQASDKNATSEQADSGYTKYPVPDVSTYQYEETSGYYYDPLTGLYYDANSQYYYNATTGDFMYWDGEKQTYLPAPSEDTAHVARPDMEHDRKEKGEKKDKVKVAKKIAKDMAKWAKSMNAQKESLSGKRQMTPNSQQTQLRREAASADAGFAMFEKVGKSELMKLNEAESNLMPPPPMPKSSPTNRESDSSAGLVASYGDGEEDSDNDDTEELDEDKLADFSKMACLLCKRQFPSREALTRHNQLSDLHKKNLADLKTQKAKSTGAVQVTMDIGSGGGGGAGQMGGGGGAVQYRDRAKERREKYGAPTPPEPSARHKAQLPPAPFEQPTKQGLGSDNVGNKLLQKMGWNAGQGLGKSKQGIVDPLMASRRQAGAGLGSRGSTIVADPEVATDYRKAAKQQLFARYRELE